MPYKKEISHEGVIKRLGMDKGRLKRSQCSVNRANLAMKWALMARNDRLDNEPVDLYPRDMDLPVLISYGRFFRYQQIPLSGGFSNL